MCDRSLSRNSTFMPHSRFNPAFPSCRFEPGDIPCIRTDVAALNGSLGRPEAQTNVLIPSAATLASLAGLGLRLGVKEDVRLLLESALRLDGQLGRHGCDMVSLLGGIVEEERWLKVVGRSVTIQNSRWCVWWSPKSNVWAGREDANPKQD